MGKAFRFAPALGGVQAASSWKIWAQVDEFYAAARSQERLGKFSFHGGRDWRFTLAQSVHRLVPTRMGADGWEHVLEIRFIPSPGRLLPIELIGRKVPLIDVPLNHCLAITILWAEDGAIAGPIPREPGGPISLWGHSLRSGAVASVTGRIVPRKPEDVEYADSFVTDLKIEYGEQQQDQVFLEGVRTSFGGPNVVLIAQGLRKNVSPRPLA
jgi:hypothetical protein